MLKKEFKQFLRDPGTPGMTLSFPFLIILVFPFAANMEVKNIRLVMVDNDHSDQSELLMEKCSSSGYFKIMDIVDSPEEAQKQMDGGKIDAILTINTGFEKYLEGSGPMTDPMPVGIKVNTINGTRGSIGSEYLNACISGFIMEAKGPGLSSASQIEVRETYRYNQFLDYKEFMIPALIVIAITMMCGFLPALNIVGEKEKGTIEQMNVTPVHKTAFIMCKMIPYVTVAYFMVFSCMLLSWIVFGYGCAGSLIDVCIFTLAHIIVMSSFGLLISNFSDNAQQAMFVIWFFSMIFMLVSGIFTPIESMPRWAKIVAYLNPLTYFADAMRGIFLKGSTLADTWRDLVCLLGIGTVTTTWAILSYHKTS